MIPLHLRSVDGRLVAFAALWLTAGLCAQPNPRYRDEVMDAIRTGLPKYDSPTKPGADTHSGTQTDSAKGASTGSAAAEGAQSKTTAESGEEHRAIEMPKVVIHPFTGEPVEPKHPLPRIPIRAPYNDVKIDDFTWGAERDRLLVMKHIAPLDRFFLGRYTLPFIGISKEARARELERIEQSDIQMNHFADVIELSQRLGIETEEDKKLREEFIRLMRTRPR